MVFTAEHLDEIDNKYELVGYPKSRFFTVGYDLWVATQEDAAVDAFKRGAQNDGCVPCMFFYVYIQRQRGNFHLLVPIALEGGVRGHIPCMNHLIDCYNNSKPAISNALSSLWTKMSSECGDTFNSEEKRKEIKKNNATICFTCGKADSKDVTLVKCGICKYYSYCGKNCQTYHWKEGKHMNECRLLILLRKYCKPSYVKEIREAIIDGQDPKEIHTLQRLRMKLGLNRPKEEYEELLLSLTNDDNNNNKPMKRGTKVQVKGLVKASKHNGKFGIVTKVLPSAEGEEGGRRRVGVKLSDNSGTVLNIKIENLESLAAPVITNRPNPYEYLVARKDGTVHIGSTANTI